MSLTLNDVYTSTKNKYKLSLLEGEKGLEKVINWVYISEDISNVDFLRGGELIITTGISSIDNRYWLFEFIKSMINCNTCGIILNIGKYIKLEDISEDIRSLCSKHNYPLFIMPWEIHIYDITHDYYDRIFNDTKRDHKITDAFLHYIRNNISNKDLNDLLESYNFPFKSSYCICILKYENSYFVDKVENQFYFQIESYLKMNHISSHIAKYKNDYIFIYHDDNLEHINISMNNLLKKLNYSNPKVKLRIGMGSLVESLDELSISYKRASAALSFAEYKSLSFYNFDEMGFFKLLLSIQDDKLLYKYVQDYLGKIIEYDNIHKSNYLETLQKYLQYNGSIQLIANDLFCHRNTINYRLHILKETLGYDLNNIDFKFNLMTAFLIKEYLSLFNKNYE